MARNILGWYGILAALSLTVFAASPYSGILSKGTALLPGGDTAGHVLVMGALAALCVLAFAGRTWRGRTLRPSSILVLVGLAVTVDEFFQAAVPTRTFEWSDLGGSLAGVALIGGLAALAVNRRQPDAATSKRPRS